MPGTAFCEVGIPWWPWSQNHPSGLPTGLFTNHISSMNGSEPHFQALGSGGFATSHRLGEGERMQADPAPTCSLQGSTGRNGHVADARGRSQVSPESPRCPGTPPSSSCPAHINGSDPGGVEVGVGMGVD